METESVLELYKKSFKSLYNLTEKTFKQLTPADFHFKPSPDSNSIAIIMKHMAGNMLSRWTDFLTTDGEKPGRKRDSEFIDEFTSQDELFEFWNKGWDCMFKTLSELTEDDLVKTVYVRKESYSVSKAILRAYSHYSYHTGQIIYIARIIKDDKWEFLTIPKARTNE